MSAKVGADDYIVATAATADDLNGLPRERLTGRPSVAGRPNQAETLVRLAREAGVRLFHALDGETGYATIPVNGHRETWRVRSSGFKRWLTRLLFEAEGKPASSQPLEDALKLLDALAQFQGSAEAVFVRVGVQGDTVYLDLANARWEAVEITAAGWRVVPDPPVRFRRARGMLSLPTPEAGGHLDALRRFVNFGNEDDWRLFVGWLVGALRPTGPYPVLVLHGEQGSAKSTAATVARSLLDPNTAPLRGDPLDVRDLMIAAANAWVLAYDNLSHLPPWLSDVFCRLATGGGFGTRELYSDAEEILFTATRPILLNGIEELVTRGDLLDRAMLLYLPPIPFPPFRSRLARTSGASGARSRRPSLVSWGQSSTR